MSWAPAERLRLLLGEPIPAGGSDADTYFTDIQITDLLLQGGNVVNRAAYEGWRMKAAHYADLITVTEGNAMRQMSDLYTHAMGMVKHFGAAGPELTSGRTRIGKIVRRY